MIFFLPRKSTSMITKIELRTSKILGSNIVTDFVKPATCAIWDEMWKKKNWPNQVLKKLYQNHSNKTQNLQ